VLEDRVPGVGACEHRITHAALNKDNGIVDPVTGNVTTPTTPRGQVRNNFAKAVAGAIVETRHQWQDFGTALVEKYGRSKASLMRCALTRDDPVNDCSRAGIGGTVVALAVSGALVAAMGVGILSFRARRRRGAENPQAESDGFRLTTVDDAP
jgi:hypothetical protein